MAELRETKKRETRQRISDIATALFFTRGFDAVTVDEIAIAAKVSKMTVFNYFARKEELILDREDDLKLVFVRDALRARPKGQSVADALHPLVAKLRAEGNAYARIDSQTAGWWRVIAASPALKARLREIAEEATDGIAMALGGAKPDGRERLVAGMIVLTWRTAHEEAIRVFESGGSSRKANATFSTLVERGLAAVDVLAAS